MPAIFRVDRHQPAKHVHFSSSAAPHNPFNWANIHKQDEVKEKTA
jgi:hypothetical protein